MSKNILIIIGTVLSVVAVIVVPGQFLALKDAGREMAETRLKQEEAQSRLRFIRMMYEGHQFAYRMKG